MQCDFARTLKKRLLALTMTLAVAASMAAPSFAVEEMHQTSAATSEVSTRAILDVPVNTKVHITSISYKSAYLNVETNMMDGVVAKNNTVGVWENTGSDSQRWYIETIDASKRWFRVGCYNHQDLTLNVYVPNNAQAKCTVYPWHENNVDDYTIRIVDESNNPIVSNKFGFVLPAYVKCMSASGGKNGNDVFWRAPDSSNTQLWDITRG